MLFSKMPTSGENGYVNATYNGISNTVDKPLNIWTPSGDEKDKASLNQNFNALPVLSCGKGHNQNPNNNEAAVVVVNACKSYKYGKKSRSVLNNFCMTVKQGTIYSLIGSSGCGKTT